MMKQKQTHQKEHMGTQHVLDTSLPCKGTKRGISEVTSKDNKNTESKTKKEQINFK